MRKTEQTPVVVESVEERVKPDKKKRRDTKSAPVARAKAPKKESVIKIKKERSKPVLQKAVDEVIRAIKPEEGEKEVFYKLPDHTDVAAEALFQTPTTEPIPDETIPDTVAEKPLEEVAKHEEVSPEPTPVPEVADEKRLAEVREELIVPNPKGTSSIDTMDTSEIIDYLATCTDLGELRDELTRRTDAYEATLRGIALLKTSFERGGMPKDEFENRLEDLNALAEKQRLAQNLIKEKIGSIMGEQRVHEQADRERHHGKRTEIRNEQPFSIRKAVVTFFRSVYNTIKNRGPWYKKIK